MTDKIFTRGNAELERSGTETKLTITGKNLAKQGAVCLNPTEEPKLQRWQLTFKDKKIFFPDEYAQAADEYLNQPNTFVASMNGYSSISEENARKYGVSGQAYEAACGSIYQAIIGHLFESFPGVRIQLIDGASDMGVDRAAQKVAKELGAHALGFSCPEFLPYVNDGNGLPVYVAEDKPSYANRYVQSLDLLVTTGGRQHALEHDLHAVFLYHKRVHVMDVLGILGRNGSAPGTIIKDDGSIFVDNAAAAIKDTVSLFSGDVRMSVSNHNRDQWPELLEEVASVAAHVCRQKMSPDIAFPESPAYAAVKARGLN